MILLYLLHFKKIYKERQEKNEKQNYRVRCEANWKTKMINASSI